MAPAVFVPSAILVASITALAGEGRAAGAVYNPLADTVPSVALPPGIPPTLQFTPVFEVPLTFATNC
jgi:hypothetical protein